MATPSSLAGDPEHIDSSAGTYEPIQEGLQNLENATQKVWQSGHLYALKLAVSKFVALVKPQRNGPALSVHFQRVAQAQALSAQFC